MNVHGNARLTYHSRAFVVKRWEAGETPRSIASAVGVSPACVYKWLRRYKVEGEAGLHGRSSRPHRPRDKTAPELETEVERLRRLRQPCWKIAAQTKLSRATVARICKRKGLSRLSALEQKPTVIRYEKQTAGEMIHIDIKKLGRIDGIGHRITGDRKGQSHSRSRKEGGKGWNTSTSPSMTTRASPTARYSPTRSANPASASSSMPCDSSVAMASKS